MQKGQKKMAEHFWEAVSLGCVTENLWIDPKRAIDLGQKALKSH